MGWRWSIVQSAVSRAEDLTPPAIGGPSVIHKAIGHLQIGSDSLAVIPLPRDAFYKATRSFYAPPTLGDAYTLEDYAEEKRHTEQVLRQSFSRHWRDHVDFEIGWDENFAFTLCGGIYTPTMLCRKYLQIICGVLRSTRQRDHWSYDTAVELQEPIDGANFMNFIVRRNELFLLNHHLGSFDFFGWFHRSDSQ
jgi:hypothetical protein